MSAVRKPMFCMTCKKQLYPVEECQCSPFEDIRKKIAALLNKHCNPSTVNAHLDEIMPLIEAYEKRRHGCSNLYLKLLDAEAAAYDE